MKYTYNTWGTCSRLIDFEIQDGIARLVEGMTPTQAISKLEGIHCGNKPTSCPDQLAQALKQALGS